MQGCRSRFKEFGAISRTYQNPPCSKPWAIAQAFCSKTVDFGPLRIHRKSTQTVPQELEIHLQGCRSRFKEFGAISRTFQNPTCSKPWAIAQAFCSKTVDFGPLRIHRKSTQTVPPGIRNPFARVYESLQGVWSDFQILPKSDLLKTMGYSPGFLLKNGRFRTLANSPEIDTNSPPRS